MDMQFVPTGKDLFFKDEGEFTTVIFSDKAIELLPNNVKEGLNGHKLDIPNASAHAYKYWAEQQNLTVDGDLEDSDF